ncbi:MAG TPA: Gfo/Idh/MocA family oxidoreductase [Candidatus Hydrogenedentes bacterium]|nr:Gfo/Idh/MocA family oxidoreductase [Candidatus Hydrogenedentota bacterium]
MADQQHSGLTRRAFLHHTTTAAVAAAALGGARRAHAKSPNDRIGVGVIGCGGRGGSHLGVLKHLQDQDKSVEIVAVCDVYRPRLNRAAEKYGAKGYMDYRELLANPKVDLVSIATPDHHHGIQTIDAVKAGKDVYCEKPVTHWRQFDVIKQLAQEVKKSGRVFQLGTQGMSDRAWHQMKKMVQEGVIGQPIHAEAGFFRVGDWGERGMHIDDPDAKPGPDLNWEAFLGDSPKRDFDVSRFFRWRMYEDYAGGPVTDLFPHTLTPVLSILGVKLPSVAVATGGKYRYEEREVPDTFNMLIDYPEKITVAVLGTQANDFQTTGQRGSGQRIPVIRGWEGSLTIQGEEIVFIPLADKGTRDSFPLEKQKEYRVKIEEGENMLHHYQNLIECAHNRSQATWSPADLAYWTQTALIMGMMSLREGKTAKFDAAKEEIVL